jgi:hypothetical protein
MSKVFVCPVVRLPKKDRDSDGKKRKDYGGFSDRTPRVDDRNNAKRPKSEKVQLREFMGSIKEFSSKSLEGMSKKAHKDDKLTKLGAAPPKQQTMPFKMKMGILQGRKKRKSKEAKDAVEAGIVVANAKLANSKFGGKKRR